jgi:uncharacterized protein
MINPTLEKLISLQKMDDRINELQAQIAEKESETEEIQARVVVIEEEVELLDHERGVLDRDRQDLETELEDDQDKIIKQRKKISEARNVREQDAGRRELENLRKRMTEKEQLILTKMERVEAIDGELSKLAEEMTEIEARLAQTAQENEKEFAEHRNQIAGYQSEKDTIFSELETGLREDYRKLLVKRAGIAVTCLANSACRLCRINLPPQLYNQVLEGSETFRCPNCQRFIYIEDLEETPVS